MAETKKTTEKVTPKAKAVKKVTPKAKVEVPEKKVAPKKAVVSSDFAVIKTGGKQYVVYAGKEYDFEKIEVEEGKDVIFEEVLLTVEGSVVKIGQPMISGAKVVGKVLSQYKDKKVMVLKYKAKKRVRKLTGHRQNKTKVHITAIK